MKEKFLKQGGFTFIELILYIATIVLLMSILVPFALNVINTGAKNSVRQEVNDNARYISERIKYEIRRASGITSVSASSISLTNFSPDSTTVITQSGNNITINKNGAGAVSLNSGNTTISNLVFTNYSSGDNKTKNIQFSFTVNANFSGGRQEYRDSQSIESDAEVRSN